ncbi:MAG: ATP/GTP-binding protein [Candidatus Hadarchaeales archaeon]
MVTLNLIMIGTAGAGKTTLAGALGKWIKENTDIRVAHINLDPGCDFTPFEPDFDIRDYFTTDGIMREENLGPNGAVVRASEMLEMRVEEFSRLISGLGADVRIVDTPGQMEVFLFHGGPRIVELLEGSKITLFVIDAEIAERAAGLVFSQMLGLSAGLRLGAPTLTVLNKIDLLGDRLPSIESMMADWELLRERLVEEGSGVAVDLMLRLSEALPHLLPAARMVKTSARTGEGIRELYDIVHEVSCACGDLT